MVVRRIFIPVVKGSGFAVAGHDRWSLSRCIEGESLLLADGRCARLVHHLYAAIEYGELGVGSAGVDANVTGGRQGDLVIADSYRELVHFGLRQAYIEGAFQKLNPRDRGTRSSALENGKFDQRIWRNAQ